MATSQRQWTVEDLDRLPDDENRYEVLDGVLAVTPPPTTEHQNILAGLATWLVPYVTLHHLGDVHFPRAVVELANTVRAEPDLFVSPRAVLRVVRPGQDDLVAKDSYDWHPAQAIEPLRSDVAAVFRGDG